jgi:protein-S-isoprenylcysteine O-methyltransferase Ste14
MLFLVYWLAGALKTRTNVKEESFASRYGVMLLVVSGYVLIFSDWVQLGFLKSHFMARSLGSAFTGLALTWLGVGLAIWARYHLGQYWSARVSIKEGHELIRTGPYARLRHPIYSGLLLATIGTALVIDKWRCVAGILLILAAFSLKARMEESMLAQQFGDAFGEHRRHTGFLIPRPTWCSHGRSIICSHLQYVRRGKVRPSAPIHDHRKS